MKLRTMGFAYLINCECQARGWDRTSVEVAESTVQHFPAARRLELIAKHVATTARLMGWSNRLRVSSVPIREGVPHSLRMDAELESLGGDRKDIIGACA